MRKRKSKKQIAKDKVWWRILLRKHSGNWDSILKSIEDNFLRTKVASLLWWDLADRKHEEDISEIYYHMRKYDMNKNETHTYNELLVALLEIGYPLDIAELRALTPKNTNGKRI